MKIDDLVRVLFPRPEASGGPRSREDFAHVLSAALEGRAEGPIPLPSAGLAGPEAASSLRDGAPEALAPALARLEAFAQALADPGMSLRELAPLARELLQDSRRLSALSRALDPASPLRALTEETAALAYVESLKFQRGDYL